MVRTLISQIDHSVIVIANTQDSQMVLGTLDDVQASDAFDYQSQALGYFRFAIQSMTDVTSIEIQVNRMGQCIELIEITRD